MATTIEEVYRGHTIILEVKTVYLLSVYENNEDCHTHAEDDKHYESDTEAFASGREYVDSILGDDNDA